MGTGLPAGLPGGMTPQQLAQQAGQMAAGVGLPSFGGDSADTGLSGLTGAGDSADGGIGSFLGDGAFQNILASQMGSHQMGETRLPIALEEGLGKISRGVPQTDAQLKHLLQTIAHHSHSIMRTIEKYTMPMQGFDALGTQEGVLQEAFKEMKRLIKGMSDVFGLTDNPEAVDHMGTIYKKLNELNPDNGFPMQSEDAGHQVRGMVKSLEMNFTSIAVSITQTKNEQGTVTHVKGSVMKVQVKIEEFVGSLQESPFKNEMEEIMEDWDPTVEETEELESEETVADLEETEEESTTA